MGDHPNPRRRYRMTRRRDAIAETRERITAAAFELHATIGPARTTVAAIAARAGVQRHTVYAHFPEVADLYLACTEHGIRATAMPEPGPWLAIADPTARLCAGLTALYAWYGRNERMLLNVLRDGGADAVEQGLAAAAPDPFGRRMSALLATLTDGREAADPARRRLVEAVLAHALAFETWRSLTGAGLADDEVVRLFAATVSALADGSLAPA